MALIFKRPKNYSAEDLFLFRVASTGFFLFKDKLICLLSEDIPLFEGKIFARTSGLPEVMLKLIYRTIYHFLEHLKIINRISEELEQKINQAMENRYLLNLFTLEKSLVYYLNAINSNAMVIEKLQHSAAKIGFSQEALEFLDDIIVENAQCLQAGRNLLEHPDRPDGRPRDDRGQQPERPDEDAEHHHHRDHGPDLRRQRLLDERRDPAGQASLRLLDHHGHGRRLRRRAS